MNKLDDPGTSTMTTRCRESDALALLVVPRLPAMASAPESRSIRMRISVLALVAACAGCSSSVSLENDSAVEVVDVVVRVGGNALGIDGIPPNDRVRVKYEPKADSSIIVEFTPLGSPRRACEADVYVTSLSEDHFEVRFDKAGLCRIVRTSSRWKAGIAQRRRRREGLGRETAEPLGQLSSTSDADVIQ